MPRRLSQGTWDNLAPGIPKVHVACAYGHKAVVDHVKWDSQRPTSALEILA